VDGSADGGAQVGRAESEETKAIVVGEWDSLLNVVDSIDETGVDSLQVTTLLHGDDAQVIFLIAPDQEGLVHVVVDTATSWPEAASVGSLEETVTLLEEEVIVDELLLDFLGHASQWVVGTLQLSLQTGKGGRDFVFHLLVLSLSQAGVEGVSLHRATATNASGNDVLTLRVQVAKSLDITEITGRMLISGLEASVVVADDGVEQIGESAVRLGIWCVDTDARVQVLHTRLNNIEECGAEGSLEILGFIEDFASQELFQEGLAVGSILHLLETGFQFLGNGSVNHFS